MKKKFNIKLDGFYRAIKRLVISVIQMIFTEWHLKWDL